MTQGRATDAEMVDRRIVADDGLRRRLALLAYPAPADGNARAVDGTTVGTAGPRSIPHLTQQRADRLLARVAWSRIVEPGDRVAALLIEALGAGALLSLLVSGAGPRRILSAARQRLHDRGEDELDLTVRGVAAGVKRWAPRVDRAATLRDVERAIETGIRVITPDDAAWPPPLRDLEAHGPLALWVRGDPDRLSNRALAVVGARAATGYGAHVTAEIVDGACASGLVIVSGAAYGIDAVAHRTALASQSPTVAVLAGGADRPYPEAHRALLARIAEHGAVCSEMVPGSAPTRWRFLQRNRIIAALASATLVTEAGVRSGSINTAGHACELGRALGAVPGPVTSAASAGCHALVRDYGATLVTNAAQAVELASQGFEPAAEGETEAEPRLPFSHVRLIDALPLRGTRALSEAATAAGLAHDEARSAAAELELLGFVRRCETPEGGEQRWALVRRQ